MGNKENQMKQNGLESLLRRNFLGAAGAAALGTRVLVGAPQTESKKPLRVGLIGAGNRGTFLGNTVQQLAKSGEPVELVAVSDIYQPRLERAETRYKAKGYAKSADLLKDASLDAVFVATPDRHHVPMMLAAIRAGKDVYSEKPLCHWSQFEELKALVHENRKLKRVIQIGTQFVADTVWEKAGEKLRSGVIGKPVHAQTCYFRRGDQGERGMKIDDPNAKPGVGLDWDAFQGGAPRRDFSVSRFFQWRLYLDYSGGPVTDTYPHALSPLIKALAPGMPKKVVALGGRYFYEGGRDVPDTFDLLIQYPQNLSVAVLGTFINATPIDTVVRGTEGTMTKRVELMQFEPAVKGAKTREEIRCDFAAEKEGHAGLSGAHITDWLDCVRTRRQPRANLELAYTVQVPILMAMQSHIHSKVALFDAEREQIRLA
jgi:predicted dehydrogenase